jgi:hypothetical protein
MKKTKLFVEHHYEFELLGFVAPLKDYKVAWVVNDLLKARLVRTDDFVLEFVDGSTLNISQFKETKDHGFLQLLKNKSHYDLTASQYLIPELKMIDYFLLMQDFTGELDINAYIGRLSESPLIQNVVKLEINKLKSKENLLTY